MICPPCKSQQHRECEDASRTGLLYSSCTCQHVEVAPAEPATGPVGE